MRVVAIIQARLDSERFPRKVLAHLQGKAILQHVVDRTSRIEGLDAIVVTCPSSDGPAISAIVRRPTPVPVMVYAPPVPAEDVLQRYVSAAECAGAAVIVRITADCPLLNPKVSTRVLRAFLDSQGAYDFVSNDIESSGYPDGWDTEVFTAALLSRAHAEAVDPADREHVTTWMKRADDVRRMVVMTDQPDTRLMDKVSVDTPLDLARLERRLS